MLIKNSSLVVVAMLVALLGGCQTAPTPPAPMLTDAGMPTSSSSPSTATTMLHVQNLSSQTIYYVYASPSSSSSWGPDLLGENVLSPGQMLSIRLPCGRTYDLKAEGSGHSVLAERYDVYLSCTSESVWALSSGG